MAARVNMCTHKAALSVQGLNEDTRMHLSIIIGASLKLNGRVGGVLLYD